MKELMSAEAQKTGARDIVPDVTVIMPIAGRATRAREITRDQIPKHLIRLGNGQTVLDTICNGLQKVGFRKFVFCVGFLKEQLISHIEKEEWVTSEETSYDFDETDRLLGPDGTALHAIGALGLRGQGMLIPGDLMLPWNNLARMNERHAQLGADITMSITSVVTERTTDVGKMIVEEETDRLLWSFDRAAKQPLVLPGARNLTSAAANVISIDRFVKMVDHYRSVFPERQQQPLSMRDEMLPWARSVGSYSVQAYDIQGEVLDLGTPANIHYGQSNWEHYI